TDIRDIPLSELRRSIEIVLQDTILFSDTIGANIRYGKLDATGEEVRYAAKMSNADVFIERMPQGYDTELTESGQNLSQGQRQLISIARAVLADPRILILDEATSSVDTRTEMHIQEAMITLMRNRTSLIIAHRLSTIRDADMIVVIDGGRIVESGSHNDLIGRGGTYFKLYQTQFAGVAI
ncbi:MAG: ATP-binding cassette domain-containing protein, partial [Eubacteriales bacterium]|nr:ATP-binding cassette domain-containing protein [Eubacteriales bacterium]